MILSGSVVSACGETSLFASVPLEVGGASGGSPSLGGAGGEMGMMDPPSRQARPTLRIEGQRILGRCDETVILRGASEMVIWSDERDGQPWFDEMAAVGANAVRVVWLPSGTGEELDRVIGNAISAGLIVVVEQHQPYFDGEELPIDDPTIPDRTVEYWTSDEILPVLEKYEASIIFEFGEKLGDLDEVEDWASRFEDMIPRFRSAGIRVPLALDAPYGGANLEAFVEGAFRVLDADPIDNSIWSVEAWGGSTEDRAARLRSIHEAGIPFFLSEFSGFESNECPMYPTDIGLLLSTMQDLDVGWFAWSWGGVSNSGCEGEGALDMTTDGHIGGLTGWGLEVAQTDANSIAKTAVKLSSLVGLECPP